MTRREFLKKSALVAAGVAVAGEGARFALENLLKKGTHTGTPEDVAPEQPAAEGSEEASLESQFEKPELLDIAGHQVRVLDIRPQEAKTEVPVIMAPGYGTLSPEDNKVNILEMARQKRRTIFVDEPRGVDGVLKQGQPEEQKLAGEKVDRFFLRQAETALAVLDKKGIARVDAVGHSEGCLYLVVAASMHPERFRDLVLFDPAGMVGDDSSVALAYRFLKENIAEMLEIDKRRKNGELSAAAAAQAKKGDEDFIAYLQADMPESLEEIRAIATQQTRALLKRAHDNGVMMTIIHGVDDDVFPMERVQKQLSRTDAEKKDGEDLIVDGFYSVKGRHDEFLLNPERYTRMADEALTALEEKRKKKEAA